MRSSLYVGEFASLRVTTPDFHSRTIRNGPLARQLALQRDGFQPDLRAIAIALLALLVVDATRLKPA